MTEQTRRATVIAIGNQKGGVGKTSNALHLAAALGELGKYSLIIDLDANCGATRGLGVGADWLGTFEVLLSDQVPEDVIVRTDPVEGIEMPENVELLPARRNLEQFEMECRRRNKFADPTKTLAGPLDRLRPFYDYIFLDTAPNASAPTLAAYLTADWFILSTEASKLSVAGLNDALMDVLAVREQGNPGLRLLGVVMCKVDLRTRMAAVYTDKIRKEFETAGEMGAFEALINRATAVEQAQSEGKTLFQIFPDHKVTGQYRALAAEVMERLERAKSTPVAPVKEMANG